MRCNAWNHPRNCDCGWGGDTSGNDGALGSSRRMTIVDGTTWSRGSKLSYNSYTIPNARCPVCSASVFFYKSDAGGRVFFDELGPPWPKHGCTDRKPVYSTPAPTHVRTGSVLDDLVFAPDAVSAPKRLAPFVSPHEWRPLCGRENGSTEDLGKHVRFPIAGSVQVPGGRLYIPSSWFGVAPIYWRWSPARDGTIELSSIRFGKGVVPEEVTTTIPGWLTADDEYLRWLANPEAGPDAAQLNGLGWAFSFAWSYSAQPDWAQRSLPVDLSLARKFFELAAVHGYWAACNNLGVMWERGLSSNINPAKAMAYYAKAALSGEAKSLRHLARCYREGIGCTIDHNMAIYYESLVTDLEAAMMKDRQAESA